MVTSVTIAMTVKIIGSGCTWNKVESGDYLLADWDLESAPIEIVFLEGSLGVQPLEDSEGNNL